MFGLNPGSVKMKRQTGIFGSLALMKQLPPASRLFSSQCLNATSGQSAGLSSQSCFTTGSTFEQGSFKIFRKGII